MSSKISHSGVVESVDTGCIRVRIVQTSACASCKVAGYCNAAEKKEKVVDVHDVDASSYSVGQAVTVSTSGRAAARALLWGFGMPFIVLVTVVVVVLMLTGNEGVAALSGLAALVPYYFLLYLMRNRMSRQISFYIE